MSRQDEIGRALAYLRKREECRLDRQRRYLILAKGLVIVIIVGYLIKFWL